MKVLIMAALRGYKRWVSPLLGQRCRFHPTCSVYMLQAVEHYGAWRGVWMGIKRLLRCHPLCDGGYDPVPLPQEHESPESSPSQASVSQPLTQQTMSEDSHTGTQS